MQCASIARVAKHCSKPGAPRALPENSMGGGGGGAVLI